VESDGKLCLEFKDNNYLGKFVLTGIPKTLRGVPKIKVRGSGHDAFLCCQMSGASLFRERLQVTFNVDSNGILEVTAEAPGLEMKLFNEFNDIH